MGSALPDRVMTNAEFEKTLDTSDEWIRSRTGIRERRIAAPEENTLTLAVTAVQDALGCRHIPAFDVAAACSGFVYAFTTAAHYLASGQYRNALVIGAETMSRVTDFEDRTVCILLGDGAGAAVVSREENGVSGLYAHRLYADGSGADLIWVPAGGSKEPASSKTVNERLHFMKMKGREVYKFAVVRLQELITETAAAAGLALSDLNMVVPHQSNLRMIESAAEKLGIPMERFAVNIDRCGNTSAASIPLAMDEARRQGRIKTGDWVMLVGIGAGLTWASALIRV
jgi:3-oxoacyl-[acyl-carrier-protein] synthase-3